MDVHGEHGDHSAARAQRYPAHAAAQLATIGRLRLQSFDVEAPTLTTADGAVYVPIRWLCDLLGLDPRRWIGLVCARYRSVQKDVENYAQQRDRERAEEGAEDRAEESATPCNGATPTTHRTHDVGMASGGSGGSGELQSDRRDLSAPALRRLPWALMDTLAHGTGRRGRLEWCLERDSLLQWLALDMPLRQVPEGLRRDQVRALRDEFFAAAATVYEHEQVTFHAVKRDLIDSLQSTQRTLATLERLDTTMGLHIEHSAATPAQGQLDRQSFVALVAEGRERHLALAEALRVALREMLRVPIIEGYEVDEEGNARAGEPMPLVPMIPDLSAVRRLNDHTATWRNHELMDWLGAHGFLLRSASETSETSEVADAGREPGAPEGPEPFGCSTTEGNDERL